MNINDLTLRQIKELQNVFNSNEITNSIDNKMNGKVCMIRTYSAGVHFGEVVEKQGQTIHLKNAQRIFSWVEACSLSQLAMEGSKDFDNCKISMPVDDVILDRCIEVIPMPADTVTAFREAKIWKK